MKSNDIVSEVANPSRGGQLDSATHVGRSGIKGEGPYMILWLRVVGGIIESAAAESHGCGYAITTANMVARYVEGRRLDDVTSMTTRDVEAVVGGLPEGKEYCAELAAQCLTDAYRGVIS